MLLVASSPSQAGVFTFPGVFCTFFAAIDILFLESDLTE
jgi:hypothetical protein